MGVLPLTAADGSVESQRALHYAIFKAATYAALVGQYRHHFGDGELPAALQEADSAAFDDAADLCDIAESETGNPHYDLVVVTRTAFESGQAHTDECAFCDERADLDELTQTAVAHANATAAALA